MMANRIGRIELVFWCGVSLFVGGIALVIIAVTTNMPIDPPNRPHSLSVAIVLIAIAAVILRALVSRLHDIGWPGWAVVLIFVPLVDIVVFLLLLVVPGQKRENASGEPAVFLRRLRKAA